MFKPEIPGSSNISSYLSNDRLVVIIVEGNGFTKYGWHLKLQSALSTYNEMFYFIPLIFMPSTMYLCSTKNKITIGRIVITPPAIIASHGVSVRPM